MSAIVAERARRTTVLCPFDLRVEGIARFLNCELVDHAVYDGLELQWFDDDEHGRGLLAFLSRSGDRRVDYYVTPGLELDPSSYEIAGGTGSWQETVFDADRLEIGPDGVVADVRFRDCDGRLIEIAADDRAAGPRRTGELLAPVGAAIAEPVSLGLVVLHGFDLLRRTTEGPRIRIDGQDVSTGTLPGSVLHRRHLIKAAGPLTVANLCTAVDGPLERVEAAPFGPVQLSADGQGISGIVAGDDERRADLRFDPPVPPLESLGVGAVVSGRWDVRVNGAPMTGGTWGMRRTGDEIAIELDVTERWQPRRGLPLLLVAVTRAIPIFRRWPTTYRWQAGIRLGPVPTMTSRWERTGDERGDDYRRATRSRRRPRRGAPSGDGQGPDVDEPWQEPVRRAHSV